MDSGTQFSGKLEKKNFIQVFMEGASRGWDLGLRMMTTSLVFAAIILYILHLLGIVDFLEKSLSPVMGIFGLSGAATVVIVAAFFSKPGGAATAAMLFGQGYLNAVECAILFPGIILFGAMIGQYARVLIVSGTPIKYHSKIIIIYLIDFVLSLVFMRILMSLMGHI